MDFELIKEIIQWDVASWAVVTKYWDSKVKWENVSNVLELGAREGGLSLWAALKNKQVVCSDLSETQKFAQPLHQKYNVTRYIQYQDIDATDIPYTNRFDVIMFKSILGGIGRKDNFSNQQKVISEIYKALKPGGYFLFAENLKASLLHQFMRKKFVRWGKEWRYVSLQDMHELLKPFSYYEIKVNGVLAAFGRTEKQREILSYFDKYLCNKICPDNWKYIGYGVAVK
ncbi:MAG: class I SAM-dependent methyltransferase [Bacteroidia bacterium]|nr:class I SAM-dependent methyltransferase [Bacteroidia bacterium]